MKNFDKYYLVIMAGLALTIFSCAPKYTAHFQNDPFYKEQNHAVSVPAEAPVEEEVVQAEVGEIQPVVEPAEIRHSVEENGEESESLEPVASQKNLIAKIGEIPSIKKLVDEHKENVEKLKESKMDQKTLEKEIRKEEKRAHKEVKKQLIKEIKEIKDTKDAEDQNAMNRKVFIGIIIAAAGIVIAILASGSVGAVAIIVGVGLIAWGLIEQGHV